jgi:hypothetical protein
VRGLKKQNWGARFVHFCANPALFRQQRWRSRPERAGTSPGMARRSARSTGDGSVGQICARLTFFEGWTRFEKTKLQPVMDRRALTLLLSWRGDVPQ